jgi:hypothetical protein
VKDNWRCARYIWKCLTILLNKLCQEKWE